MREPDYICFSDESYIGERFRTIAACTCSYATYKRVHHELMGVVASSKAKEFKWEKLRNAKYLLLAESLMDFAFREMHASDLRVDILTWDIQDSRHARRGRNDRANFERMLYHLINTTLRRRPQGSTWRIYPDQKLDVDWKTVESCISLRGKRRRDLPDSLFSGLFSESPYSIELFQEAQSHEAPLCQLADLFAGLASFAALRYEDFSRWKYQDGPNLSLLPCDDSEKFSNSDKSKFRILDRLHDECKRYKYGVSLRQKKRFFTYNPKGPLNFWPYEPQGEYDRAPVVKG